MDYLGTDWKYGYTLSSTPDLVVEDSRFETVYKCVSKLARGQRDLIHENKCIMEMIEAVAEKVNKLEARLDEQERLGLSQLPQA